MTIRSQAELLAAIPGTWNENTNRGPQGVIRTPLTFLQDTVDTLFGIAQTPFVASPDGSPYTLQEALTAAGAIATASQWATVFAKDGQYLEDTVVYPPNVLLIGTGQYGVNHFTQLGQSWLIGGFDMTAAGERAIRHFGIRRATGSDPCLDMRSSGDCDVWIDNVGIQHQQAASAIKMQGIGSGFATLTAIRSLIYGAVGSATPLIDIADRSFLDARNCWLWLNESGAGQKLLTVAYNCILELCNIIGAVEVTATGALADLISTYQSLYSSCVDIAAGGWLANYLPSYYWGVGNDIAGAGDLYGCGAIWGLGPLIAGTVTVTDDGGRVAYKAGTPGDWAGSAPDTHKGAIDRLASAGSPVP